MRQINLVLTPAEARALQGALNAYCLVIREQGLGPDELPGFYHRLERVQRLLSDGLNYLGEASPTTARPKQCHDPEFHEPHFWAPTRLATWYCLGLHPARSA